MHDTNLLQLINDDFAPAQQLLELLQTESLALHGRDMPLLEEILAHKQALIILLEQHGRKRSEILASLNLPTDRSGLAQLASQSSISGCVADSPMIPKSFAVGTMPTPKCCCQTRFIQTRAVSG